MYLIGIDIGITNLGLVGFYVNQDYTLCNIDLCDIIDIKELTINCSDPDCELEHDMCVCDYMSHLYKLYDNKFKIADKIIIERQPIGGILSVQELLLREYRNKVVLVSPNSMHKHFMINHFNYETRKKCTVKIASPHLDKFNIFGKDPDRSNHMADAFCILKFYLYKQNKKYKDKKEKEEFLKIHKKTYDTLNSFRYTGND